MMNIFPILTGIPQKSCKRSFFIFIKKQSKRSFCFELVWQGKCINQKKLNVKTSSISYTKRTHQSCYLQNVLTGHNCITNKGCQTLYLKSRGLYSSQIDQILRMKIQLQSHKRDLNVFNLLPFQVSFVTYVVDGFNYRLFRKK